MNYRSILPTLALCATMLPSCADAQAAPRKPSQPPASTRGADTRTEPAAIPAMTPNAARMPTDTPAERESVSERQAPGRGERPHFGIMAAVAAPMSSLGRAFSAGYVGGVFVQGRPATLPVSLRGDVHYARFTGKNDAVTPSYSVTQATGAVVYDFRAADGTKAPFFATGGLGLYRTTVAGATQTDFGQNLGAGFHLRQAWGKPIIEGRFHFFNDVEYFALSLGFRR